MIIEIAHWWLIACGATVTAWMLAATVLWVFDRISDSDWVEFSQIKPEFQHSWMMKPNQRPYPRGLNVHVPPFKRMLWIRLERRSKWQRSEHAEAWRAERFRQYQPVQEAAGE